MRNRVLTKFTYALLIIICVLTVACSPTESYLPNEVDFRTALPRVDQNDFISRTEYSRMISEFDNYVAIWASLVTVGSRDGSEKSFTDFVRSTLESTQLTSQAVLALGHLLSQDTNGDNRVLSPREEEDATIGCKIVDRVLRRKYGTVLARRVELGIGGCHSAWIEFQVEVKIGTTTDDWIAWLAIRKGVYEIAISG